MTTASSVVSSRVAGVCLAIVIPVYDDWESFTALMTMLDRAFCDVASEVTILAVDDGSTRAIDRSAIERISPFQVIRTIEVLHLVTNVGHQRAIAIGVTEAVARGRYSYVMVMDSDGEDRPEDAVRLLRSALDAEPATSEEAFVAQRHRRSEGIPFRIYYVIYKMLFRFLSGETIDFGNFSLLPVSVARRLTHMPETWNHFAASIVKARVPLRRIPTTRGRRIAGRSTMNLVSLVTLGLSAISVYSDAVFVRMLLTSLLLSGASALGIATVVAIRLFTRAAIPGWATSAGGLLGIALLQLLTLSTIASFLTLGARAGVLTVPATDAARFVDRCEILVAE